MTLDHDLVAAMLGVLRDAGFQSFTDQVMKIQHQLAVSRDAEHFAGQTELAALSLYRQERSAQLRASRLEAHAEELQRIALAHEDEAEVRKRAAELIPAGNWKVLVMLRGTGRGDLANQYLGDARGVVYPAIGAGLKTSSKVVLAIMAAAQDPSTQAALRFRMTMATAYCVGTLQLGGAPVAGSTKMDYHQRATLGDFRTRLVRQMQFGVRQDVREIPKLKDMGFISNAERETECFMDIGALCDAWDNLGRILAMTYGRRLGDTFELCGKQMRRLYETDSMVWHLKLLEQLSNLSLEKYCGELRRLAEDEDYRLSPL